jgi:hypothetical protein
MIIDVYLLQYITIFMGFERMDGWQIDNRCFFVKVQVVAVH